MKKYYFLKSMFIIISLLCAYELNAKTITINYWNWSRVLDPFIKDFEQRHPDIKVKLSQYPTEQMKMKVLTAMRSKNSKSIPDLIALESAFTADFIAKDIFRSLEDFDFRQYEKDIVPYVWRAGLDKSGKLIGISWQATPGAFYYRRSLAKKYLGTDDPDKVSKLIDSWDKFFKVIEKINSGEKKFYFLDNAATIILASESKYQSPMIENDKLIIGDITNELFTKLLKFAQLRAGVQIANDDQLSRTLINNKAFGYLIAPWFVGSKLQMYVPQQSGDWAVVPGPTAFSSGGTWLVIPKSVTDKQKLQALRLFLYELAFNRETSEKFLRQRGDYPANKLVFEKVKNSQIKFLKNQQQMKYLSVNVENIYNSPTKYDPVIRSVVTEIYNDMLVNPDKYTVESATKKYINDIKKLAPEIKVE